MKMTNDKRQMTNECQMPNAKLKIWGLSLIWILPFGFCHSCFGTITGKPVNRPTGQPKKGQSTLELTAALILLMLLLIGAAKIFFWLSGRMVHRQVLYENSRVPAASPSTYGVHVDLTDQASTQGMGEPNESTYPALNVFK